jgi:hypothetical protein
MEGASGPSLHAEAQHYKHFRKISSDTHQLGGLWVGIVILQAPGHLSACGACATRHKAAAVRTVETRMCSYVMVIES